MKTLEWDYIGGVIGVETWREKTKRKYKIRDKKAQRISKIN
jgi:hypothetical protein